MAQPQLNPGPAPVQDHRDRIIKSLEGEVRDLSEQLRIARQEVEQARNEGTRGILELRKILSPLFNGLKLIFNELDGIAPDYGTQTDAAPSHDKKRAIWESWKRKLGGHSANFIDMLLEHDQMTAAQLRVAMHCGKDSVYQTASKLGKLGLVQQNGGKYSLKEL